MNRKQVRWFSHLKHEPEQPSRALLDHWRPAVNNSIKVISRQNEYGVYEYTAFDNHIDLFKYVVACSEANRCFHEVPLGNVFQKPRFDIDIKTKALPEGVADVMAFGHQLRLRLLERIVVVLNAAGIKLDPAKHFLLYNTHRQEKYSSHILIDGYFHADCEDALGFYEKVVGDDEQLQKYVDRAVYHRNHSLRMLWCRKTGVGKAKTQEMEFEFDGRFWQHETLPNEEYKISLLRQFEKSLITFTSQCLALPPYATRKKRYDAPDIPEEVCKEMFSMMQTKMEEAPFEITKIEGNLVSLQRYAPSYCSMCDKVHNRMSPFLIVTAEKTVYLRCALAAKGKRIELGSLSPQMEALLIEHTYASELIDEIEKEYEKDQQEYEARLASLLACQDSSPTSSSEETKEESKIPDQPVFSSLQESPLNKSKEIDTPSSAELVKEEKKAVVKPKRTGRPQIVVDSQTELRILHQKMLMAAQTCTKK